MTHLLAEPPTGPTALRDRSGPAASAPRTETLAPSVLIIDDDAAVRSSLARALSSEGFLVRTAADAEEGLLRSAIAEPDIVLLDLTMPGRDGWDTFEEISRFSPLLPVVIITARPAQFETARQACVAALVEKPIDISSLLATMRRLLDEDENTRLARLTHHAPATRLVRPALRQRPPGRGGRLG